MLRVEGVSKSWGAFSLKDVSLEVNDGEYFVILGPTGAGKTLLLETIAGLHQPETGEIWLNGKKISDLPPEKRNIGFVFQNYALFPHMTVWENVSFGLEARGVPFADRISRIEKALELTGLKELSERYPETLSGGEQQRTALARALVTEPPLFLLDEPLSALDFNTQEALRQELKRIHGELGITTVHVTHDHAEAMILADRIGVMNDGRIVQIGTPDEVFSKPMSEFVANFVGFENVFRGFSKIENGIAKIDINGIRVEAVTDMEGPVKVCVRPEDILISKKPFKSSARNLFKGKVVEISERGPLIKLKVAAGINFVIFITRRSFLEMAINVGSEVYLSFKASSVHVF
jgi:molybdopterin-binding protein